jgi:hypothetical protein
MSLWQTTVISEEMGGQRHKKQYRCVRCGAQDASVTKRPGCSIFSPGYFPTVVKREKRAGAQCPEQAASTPQAPKRIVDKSLPRYRANKKAVPG